MKLTINIKKKHWKELKERFEIEDNNELISHIFFLAEYHIKPKEPIGFKQ